MINRWKANARSLKLQTLALYYAYRHPRVPWYAKAWIAIVVAYAFSPIDLIPDFIPILGYLDDLVLIPLGVAAAIKMIPSDVMAESRAAAERHINEGHPRSKLAAAVIILLWALAIFWVIRLFLT